MEAQLQTPAPSAQAGNKKAPRKAVAKHPAFPTGVGGNTFAWNALFDDAALSRISALEERLWNAKNFKASGEWLATRSAAAALFEQTSASFKAARDHGDLLLCWHGTQAIEIRANAMAVAP